MKNDEYKYMINSYFDGEMNRENEAMLFTYLSQDADCREYFKKMNLVKSSVEKTIEEFPHELEERIFYSLQKKESKKLSFLFTNNFFTAASYALAVILLIVSILFYNESNNYREKLEKTIEHVNKQEQLIHVIINSLPTPDIKVKANNEVIVTSKL
ncbi:MAG: hypothetical protein KJ571_03920 [Bacteroidetes bacterium]|nr:hypothetical protein [Bacteroidota bacterium]